MRNLAVILLAACGGGSEATPDAATTFKLDCATLSIGPKLDGQPCKIDRAGLEPDDQFNCAWVFIQDDATVNGLCIAQDASTVTIRESWLRGQDRGVYVEGITTDPTMRFTDCEFRLCL